MSQPLETYPLREEKACGSKPGFKISTITENLGQFDGKRVTFTYLDLLTTAGLMATQTEAHVL